MKTLLLSVQDQAVERVRWMLEHFEDEVEIMGMNELDPLTHSYMQSEKFHADREMFHEIKREIESGNMSLVKSEVSTKNIKDRLSAKYGDC